MIPWLGADPVFPPLSAALVSPDRLLAAYAQGIFPWYAEGEPILWWSPAPRMVLYPSRLRVTRSLDKLLRNRSYEIRLDTAFRQVMQGCAAERSQQTGTWIMPEMIEAYCALHQQGYAHSFETWVDGELAGGLYGVGLGLMFYGESMFSRQRDASKLAFIHMVRHLAGQGVQMIDCQMYTPHLASLGAIEVPRADFVATLKEQTCRPQPANLWKFDYRNEPPMPAVI